MNEEEFEAWKKQMDLEHEENVRNTKLGKMMALASIQPLKITYPDLYAILENGLLADSKEEQIKYFKQLQYLCNADPEHSKNPFWQQVEPMIPEIIRRLSS